MKKKTACSLRAIVNKKREENNRSEWTEQNCIETYIKLAYSNDLSLREEQHHQENVKSDCGTRKNESPKPYMKRRRHTLIEHFVLAKIVKLPVARPHTDTNKATHTYTHTHTYTSNWKCFKTSEKCLLGEKKSNS